VGRAHVEHQALPVGGQATDRPRGRGTCRGGNRHLWVRTGLEHRGRTSASSTQALDAPRRIPADAQVVDSDRGEPHVVVLEIEQRRFGSFHSRLSRGSDVPRGSVVAFVTSRAGRRDPAGSRPARSAPATPRSSTWAPRTRTADPLEPGLVGPPQVATYLRGGGAERRRNPIESRSRCTDQRRDLRPGRAVFGFVCTSADRTHRRADRQVMSMKPSRSSRAQSPVAPI